MPMGLFKATHNFYRVLNHTLLDILDDCVIIYLDNILNFSNIREIHLESLHKAFSKLISLY